MRLPFTPAMVTANAGNVAAFAGDAANIISAPLATASGAPVTFTVQSPSINTGSILLVNVANGTNTGGFALIGTVTPSAGGSAAVAIWNVGASAFNGTLVLNVVVFN